MCISLEDIKRSQKEQREEYDPWSIVEENLCFNSHNNSRKLEKLSQNMIQNGAITSTLTYILYTSPINKLEKGVSFLGVSSLKSVPAS